MSKKIAPPENNETEKNLTKGEFKNIWIELELHHRLKMYATNKRIKLNVLTAEILQKFLAENE
jgi:predicted HicB family RNase H-like nuclease